MDRILVTGANGFTARHLLPRLAAERPGDEVAGTDLRPEGPPEVRYVAADLTDPAEAAGVVEAVEPTLVFHLAGISSPDPDRCFAVNLDGTRRLLEGLAALAAPPRVILVSSAAVYGLTLPEESPVGEGTPLRPLTPYGASKAAAELFAFSLHRRGRIAVTVVRPFNLVGPGLPEGLAPSDFAAQVRRIRDGGAEPVIRTGNLTPRRDFLDVRDAVMAYIRLAASPVAFGETFNVGSGRPTAVRTVLDDLVRLAGIEVRVETDPGRVRSVDVPEQVADLRALGRAIEWRPRVSLEASLRDMLAP